LAIETGKFAAICSLAASFFEGMTIPYSVPQISVMQLHGDSDFSVPFDGGQSYAINMRFESAISTVEKWAVHNDILTEPEILSPFENTSLYLYNEDGNNNEVRLYKLYDTGHNIFSHFYLQSSTAINDIWSFFRDKRL
jgi:poly(3-hydroxybutyrate) depolymerase